MEIQDKKSLHIAMFPWLAFGHMIPYLDISKLMAQRGHKISFISTPRNIDRLPNLPPNLASSISLVKIPLPKLAELPENAEATMDLEHANQMDSLKKAFDGLESGLNRFLEESRPDWIIYDFAPHWLPPITTRLRIHGAVFFIMNAWFLAFFGPTHDLLNESDYRTKPEDFMVPPKWVEFDSNIRYRRFEANWVAEAVHNSSSGISDTQRLGKVIDGTEALVVRHCREIEPEWLNVLGKLHNTPIIPVGLMPPAPAELVGEESSRDEDWTEITEFLNCQEKRSVAYVALGSEVTPSKDQLNELAHGLELSGVPFFWVLRKASGLGECESMEMLDGFEKRVSGRGLVWRRWAPQLKILSHDSVGGFLTHCGWSSFIEGLAFGQPLITLPFLVDQGLNSRVIVDWKLGVEIPRNEMDGTYTRNSVADSVKLVMMEDDGKIFREKANKMSAIFGDTKLHVEYVHNFIHFLENRITEDSV